jgi:hypothetical protein
MRRFTVTLKVMTLAVFMLALTSVAQAQASRTWVSGVGDDFNPCSRTAPCKTFAGAISKTALNGEINALDPAGYGTLTITKSITVNGAETNAGVLNSGLNAFTINYDSFTAVGETRKSVRIRNVSTQGFDNGTGGVRIIGAASSGSEVLIENMWIDGNNAGNGRGISDERSGGGELFVNNVTISNQSGNGIHIAPSSGGTTIHASLNNVRIYNCNFGVVVSSGARVVARGVVASGNTNAGFFVEGLTAAAELNVSESVSSSNGTGVHNGAGAFGATFRIATSDIVFNTTAVTGTVSSYGNNRVAGGAGALTLLGGGDTLDNGQQ